MQSWTDTLFEDFAPEWMLPYLSNLVLATEILIVCVLVNWIARKLIIRWIHHLTTRTRTQWDNMLASSGVFSRLSHIAPAMVIYFTANLFLHSGLSGWLQRVATAYIVIVGAWSLHAFLEAVVTIYRTTKYSRTRPIRGYVQTFQILVMVIAGVLVVATLLNRSPMAFLTGIGALSAVLMLVFRDSILGLVAGIQLTANDMVRIGDWIEMPKYGADGDVLEVSLNTVKVQNWDKTITTIPTHALISDSFKNWRGMQQSGGRRIKRALMIDLGTVKFCDFETLDRYEQYEYVGQYIKERRTEIDTFNQEEKVDTAIPINGRRITNIGSFRAYIEGYLRQHPKLHKEGMTFLVRQLAPTEKGLPMEIYVFTNDTRWIQYEAIQADIFDHLLAAAPWFDLAVYQAPSGHDLEGVFPSGS